MRFLLIILFLLLNFNVYSFSLEDAINKKIQLHMKSGDVIESVLWDIEKTKIESKRVRIQDTKFAIKENRDIDIFGGNDIDTEEDTVGKIEKKERIIENKTYLILREGVWETRIDLDNVEYYKVKRW